MTDSTSSATPDGRAVAPFKLISSPAEFARFLGTFVAIDTGVLGGSDIYLLNYEDPPTRAGVLVGALLGLAGVDGRRLINNYVLVVPPPVADTDEVNNTAVDRAFALDPSHGLAMTVFGNPLLVQRHTKSVETLDSSVETISG